MFQELFEKLKTGLSKTKTNFTDRISDLLHLSKVIDEELYEELEEILITADIGSVTSEKIISKLKEKVKEKRISDPLEFHLCIKEIILDILTAPQDVACEKTPKIILVIGVNGVGKTTSIGKLSSRLRKGGNKVIVAAADTFRAAAIDQLEIWSNRAGVEIIKQQEGSDPAAVVFDAIQAAKSRQVDYLLCDTAGRLHNKKNLMNELSKINRIIEKEGANFNIETLLVLDASTGQNALSQAKEFMEVAKIDGLILTKLDGTAKGGIIIAIKSILNLPVKYIGVGEGIDDLQEFHSEEFVDALFGC
jgi:fused signal recognition particle receptor